MKLRGMVSHFGGPDDDGVAPDESLAFIYEVSDAPQLFLDEQPPGTTGLARRLNPDVPYIACRWNYDETPREMLLDNLALVRSVRTGHMFSAYPADWGPHESTGRIADISPGLMQRLGIETDDEVEVIFPIEEFDHMLDKAVIDVSHWDDVTSFAQAKKAGVVAIISKATESDDYRDPTYEGRRQEAEAAGLLWGAYHFLRPGNMQDQADFFLAFVGTDLDLYAADHEDDAVSLDDLKEFLQAVYEATGKRAVIYSGYVLKEQIGDGKDEELAQYRLWLAQYTSGTPSWPTETWPKWWLWQYTETGDCPGIPGDSEGDLDLNKYSGTAAQLRAEWTDGEPAPAPEPEQAVVTITIVAPPNVTVKVIQEAEA